MPSELLTGRRWVGVVAVAAAVLASLCVSAPAFAQPTLGGEWHMDALSVAGEGIWSTPDTSGNGLGLSGNVPPSALVPGRWGNAVGFNAADFYELSTTQPQPDLEPAHVAVMAWVKAAQSPGPNAYIIAQGGGPTCTPSSYALTTGGDGGLQFDVSDGASVSPSADPGPHVWDGNWHFVVGTYDGTTVRLYVDGSEVTPGTASDTVIGYQLPTDTFTVGGYPDPNCRQFAFYTGALDEVRVYDRALNADEISQLQQASTGDTPPELGGTTTTTTTGTTPTAPGLSHPVAKFVVAGPSATLKRGTWFNGATSIAAAGAPIVSYAWDPTGTGNYSDPCGSAPIASLMFASRGIHTIGLQVTDGNGVVSTYRQTVLVTAAMVNRALGAASTFDCENPAGGGDQPSTADCVKTFAWSIIDVNSRGRSDDCFTITSRIRPVHGVVPIGFPAAARAAGIKNALYTYHATVTGPVALNGLYVPVPHAVKTVYDTGDGTIGLGSVPLRVGPLGTQTLNLGFHVTLQNLPVSDCYSHPTQGYRLLDSGTLNTGVKKIAGLPVQGGVGVDLLNHSSRIILNVGLPNIFGFAPGNPAQGTLCLNLDNTNGLSIDGAKIGPIPNAFIGPIALQNLTFHYVADDNLWEGGATVTLPGSLYGLNASPPPPDLGFGIKDGNFDHAGIGLDFPPAAQPELFPGVFLTNIHVALGTDPLRFTGGIGLTAAQILAINGDVFVAFASPDQPYSFPVHRRRPGAPVRPHAELVHDCSRRQRERQTADPRRAVAARQRLPAVRGTGLLRTWRRLRVRPTATEDQWLHAWVPRPGQERVRPAGQRLRLPAEDQHPRRGPADHALLHDRSGRVQQGDRLLRNAPGAGADRRRRAGAGHRRLQVGRLASVHHAGVLLQHGRLRGPVHARRASSRPARVLVAAGPGRCDGARYRVRRCAGRRAHRASRRKRVDARRDRTLRRRRDSAYGCRRDADRTPATARRPLDRDAGVRVTPNRGGRGRRLAPGA